MAPRRKILVPGHLGGVDPNSVFLGLPLFRSKGLYLHQREQYKNAVERLNEAIFIAPGDRTSVALRASAYVKMQEYEKALKDAEELLRLDPDDLNALFKKAQALYMSSEFEQALMFHHRGFKLRHKPPIFQEGILACEETIEDCIGRNVGAVVLDHIDTIKEMERYRRIRLREDHMRLILKKDVKITERAMTPKLQWLIKTIQRQAWTRYLGPFFAKDYFFSEELIERAQIISSKRKSEFLDIAKECCANLTKTKETLRDRKPYYSYTYTDPTLQKALKKRKEITMQNKMKVATNMTLGLVKKLSDAERSKVKDFVTLALRTKEHLDETPPKLLPNKEEYLTLIYELVASTYLQVLRLLPDKDEERQLKQYFALPVEGTESMDDFLKAAHHPYADSHATVRVLQEKLKTSESRVEQAWLHHDVALAHLIGGFKLETGRWHARKAVKCADDIKWEILTRMVSGRLEFRLGNFREAKKCFEDALNLAKGLGDLELTEFINECLDFNCGIDSDLIEEREKTILTVLADETMKKEAESIFRHIASQPTKRRMSLVPGVKPRSVRSASAAGSRKSTGYPSKMSSRRSSGVDKGTIKSFRIVENIDAANSSQANKVVD